MQGSDGIKRRHHLSFSKIHRSNNSIVWRDDKHFLLQFIIQPQLILILLEHVPERIHAVRDLRAKIFIGVFV